MSRKRLGLEPRNELLEAFDAAASAHSRVDKIALRANPLVVGLEVEALVKVERAALALEGRPDPLAAKEQVDATLPGEEGGTDGVGVEAFESLARFPFDATQHGLRPNRDTHNPGPLDNHQPHRRLRLIGLNPKEGEQ